MSDVFLTTLHDRHVDEGHTVYRSLELAKRECQHFLDNYGDRHGKWHEVEIGDWPYCITFDSDESPSAWVRKVVLSDE